MSVIIVLANLALLGLLVWWLQRQNWAKALQPYFWPALGLKLAAAVVYALWRFQFLPSGDTMVYHRAALELWAYAQQEPALYLRLLFLNEFESEAFRQSLPFTEFPGFSNSFFFTKLLSLLNHLTQGNYYLNNGYLALYSFFGSTYAVAMLSRRYPEYKAPAALAFLFFPSVVFWSTGVSKDPLMYGSMCWLLGATVALAHRYPFRQWLLLPLQLGLFVQIKVFYAAFLLPLLLAYLLVQRLRLYFSALDALKNQLLFVLVLFGVVLLAVVLQVEYLSPDFIFTWLHRSYTELLPRSLHHPHISLPELEPTFASLLWHYPEAAVSSIYRPLPGESWQFLFLLSSLENLLLLWLTAVAVVALYRHSAKPDLLCLLLLAFVLVMAGITGLSTPNFGTLSRYRIVYLPLLVFLLLQNKFALRWLHRWRLF